MPSTRYVILGASILLHLALGGVYAWSALVPSLQAEHGLGQVESQAVFGVMIAVFATVMVGAGRLLPRLGPRPLAAAGGLLLGAGYIMASMGSGRFVELLACIAILGGAGTGLAYVCPIAAVVQWFPARKGLVTGLTVCAFGAGGAALASFIAAAQNGGMTSLEILRWTGAACGTAAVCAGMLLRFPPTAAHAGAGIQTQPPGYRTLLADRQFWILASGMFAGTFAGLMIIGNLRGSAAACGATQQQAVLAVSLFAAGNAAGRVTWGWIADRIGATTVPASLGVLAMAGVMLAGSHGGTQILAASALCGFGFGACFVVYAAQVSERFGIARLGSVYPLIFLFYGLAGLLGPLAGGWLGSVTGSVRIPIAVAAGIPAVAAAAWAVLSRSRGRTMEGSRLGISARPVQPCSTE